MGSRRQSITKITLTPNTTTVVTRNIPGRTRHVYVSGRSRNALMESSDESSVEELDSDEDFDYNPSIPLTCRGKTAYMPPSTRVRGSHGSVRLDEGMREIQRLHDLKIAQDEQNWEYEKLRRQRDKDNRKEAFQREQEMLLRQAQKRKLEEERRRKAASEVSKYQNKRGNEHPKGYGPGPQYNPYVVRSIAGEQEVALPSPRSQNFAIDSPLRGKMRGAQEKLDEMEFAAGPSTRRMIDARNQLEAEEFERGRRFVPEQRREGVQSGLQRQIQPYQPARGKAQAFAKPNFQQRTPLRGQSPPRRLPRGSGSFSERRGLQTPAPIWVPDPDEQQQKLPSLASPSNQAYGKEPSNFFSTNRNQERNEILSPRSDFFRSLTAEQRYTMDQNRLSERSRAYESPPYQYYNQCDRPNGRGRNDSLRVQAVNNASQVANYGSPAPRTHYEPRSGERDGRRRTTLPKVSFDVDEEVDTDRVRRRRHR